MQIGALSMLPACYAPRRRYLSKRQSGATSRRWPIETSAQVSLKYRVGNDLALEAILWDALQSKETWAEKYSAGSEGDTLRTMTDKTPIIQSSKASPDKIIPTLTEAQIARIAAYGRARRVQRGEVLVEAGARTARFFVVTAGQIEIIRRSGATEELIAIFGPGMFTGEVTLLTGRRGLAQIRASEAGE